MISSTIAAATGTTTKGVGGIDESDDAFATQQNNSGKKLKCRESSQPRIDASRKCF